MPSMEMEKIQKADSVEKVDLSNIEYNEIELLYDKVIKRLKMNFTI